MLHALAIIALCIFIGEKGVMLALAILIIGVPLLCLTLANDAARYMLGQTAKVVLCFGGAALSLYILFLVLIIAKH